MAISRVLIALLAPAGVVAAHALAYSAAHGWEHERQAMLTGHGPLAMLAAVALPLVFLALVVVVVTTPSAGRPRLRHQAVTQIGVFAVVEFLERVVEVQSLATMLHDPAVWLGVAAQLATATLVLVLVRGTDRLVSGTGIADEPGPQHTTATVWHPAASRAAGVAAFLRSMPRRGPPPAAAVLVRS